MMEGCVALHNVIESSVKGCHIAHFNCNLDWIVSYQKIDPDSFPKGPLPDISIDPEDHLLSVLNTSPTTKSYYLTVGHPARADSGHYLEMAPSTDESGRQKPCLTFVLVVEAGHVMDVCYLQLPKKKGRRGPDVDLYSHISDVTVSPPPPSRPESYGPYPVPLSRSSRYLCSQGFGGSFTHFTPATYFAVDFEVAIGTPLYACGDGVVVSVKQDHSVSGIHARNLFLWNSVMIRLDGGPFVEYVHIKKGSVVLKVGMRVKEGDKICESGNVGFCPEPHLHLQMYNSDQKDAVSLKFLLKDDEGRIYEGTAGETVKGFF
eukprot:TRINITY_DN14754_c0_g1_i1.p1 TRINITY_DN14754_c0_g1~~TRINITY_DN14754_c0_g1_i1.p1  ORF type:complete len:318 (+),score=58.71 TRINITY_DN14754_c0_g1_i1:97-1050(+)